MKRKIALVRGKFLNQYEMQLFEPLVKRLPAGEAGFDLTAFGSLTPFHDRFNFPVVKLPSPMDLPNFPYKMPILNRLFIDAHYLVGLEEKLKGFDLVHTAETYFRYTQQCLNAKRKGYVKKVIASVYENIPFNNEGIWGRKAFKKRAREGLDHIIAITHKTKDALIKEGTDPKKITVIGHFVDTKRFHPSPKASDRRGARRNALTILFVGRLEEYKGVLDILDAAEILSKDPDLEDYVIRWLFVGEGSQERRMRERETSLGLFANHEVVPYSDMPRVYSGADIFVAPSKPRFVRASRSRPMIWDEQFGIALLEAQAAGLPIVTTKTGGIPENVGDAGVYTKTGDVKMLAKSIKEYIVKPNLRVSFGEKARKRAVAVHDVAIGAGEIADLYLSLLP